METCILCGREFNSVRSLAAHVKCHREVSVPEYWELAIPPRQCKCGCGETTPIYRGERADFVVGHNMKGGSNPNLGKRYTEERKEKIRKSNLGQKRSEETRRRISEAQSRIWTPEAREKARQAKLGSKSPNWKGGRQKELKALGMYGGCGSARLLNLVRKRDKNICRMCGKTAEENGRNMDVHHIVPFLESEDNSMENLICLCRNCHTIADRNNLSKIQIIWYYREKRKPI